MTDKTTLSLYAVFDQNRRFSVRDQNIVQRASDLAFDGAPAQSLVPETERSSHWSFSATDGAIQCCRLLSIGLSHHISQIWKK
jgi:hypothetical protein